MKFLVVSAAIALSLLATPGCKQLKCGKGTVEEDGKCVIPKPKDCGKLALGPEASALYTLVKAERGRASICSLVLKAKQTCSRRVMGEYGLGDVDCELTAVQYDKDGVKLGETPWHDLSKLGAGEAAKQRFHLEKGSVKTWLVMTKPDPDWPPR